MCCSSPTIILRDMKLIVAGGGVPSPTVPNHAGRRVYHPPQAVYHHGFAVDIINAARHCIAPPPPFPTPPRAAYRSPKANIERLRRISNFRASGNISICRRQTFCEAIHHAKGHPERRRSRSRNFGANATKSRSAAKRGLVCTKRQGGGMIAFSCGRRWHGVSRDG